MNKRLNNVLSKIGDISSIQNKKITPSSIKNIEKYVSHKNEEVWSMLRNYFKHLIIGNNNFIVSNPTFEANNNKVNIKIFYYLSEGRIPNTLNFTSLNKEINIIMKVATKLYNKDVSFNFTRIYYPYLNANIFCKYICHNTLSNNFLHFQNAIRKYPRFNFSAVKEIFVMNKFRDYVRNYSDNGKTLEYGNIHMPHEGIGIIGVKIQISGRLATERVIPRVTKKSMVFGSLSKANFVDYSSYTGKNYLGSFTVKVWIGQSLYSLSPETSLPRRPKLSREASETILLCKIE